MREEKRREGRRGDRRWGHRKLVLAHDSLARAKQANHCKFISGQGARFACCSRSWEGSGRAGGREWQVCGNFLATATAASDNRNAYKHEISAMSAHPTCLLTRQNHSYPWQQQRSSRGAAEEQQRSSIGTTCGVVFSFAAARSNRLPMLAEHVPGPACSAARPGTGQMDRPAARCIRCTRAPTYKGLCSGPTVKKTIEDIVILFVKCRFLNNY